MKSNGHIRVHMSEVRKKLSSVSFRLLPCGCKYLPTEPLLCLQHTASSPRTEPGCWAPKIAEGYEWHNPIQAMGTV